MLMKAFNSSGSKSQHEEALYEKSSMPVQRLDLAHRDRLEMVAAHVYRKSISGEGLGVSVFWMKPSDDPTKTLIPKHKHGEEMVFVIKGRATLTIEGDDYPI